MLKTLLEHGANPNQTDSNNFTPLMIAAEPEPYFNMIKLLIEYNADWNIKDINGDDFIDVLQRNEFYYFVDILKNKYPEKYQEYLIKKEAEKYNI